MGCTRSAIAALAVQLLAAGMVHAECGSYEDEERTSHRRVSWADFKGPKPIDHQVRLKKVSQIATALRLGPRKIEVRPEEGDRWVARAPELCVRAFMLKHRSGDDPDHRTPRGLAHEQGHFDITEYFARQLRRELTALEYRAGSSERAREGLRKAIAREYSATVVRWKRMQARYDRETRHSQRRAAQTHWLEKIRDLLADSAPPVAAQPRSARAAPDRYTQEEARYRP